MGCCHVSGDKVTITEFYCCGVVDITSIVNTSTHTRDKNSCRSLGSKHGMAWCSNAQLGLMPVDDALEADENANTCSTRKILNPAVPFNESILEKLYVGRAIDIRAVVKDNADRFSINLDISDKEILFHLNPRFDRRIVIRNYRRSGDWGEEELAVSRPFPFRPGHNTFITLFIFDAKLLVSVDGDHFCEFQNRSPVHLVRRLRIEGDLTLTSITYKDSNRYPDVTLPDLPAVILPNFRFSPQVTSIKRDVKCLFPGCAVEITGRVKLLPQNFYLNLQVGSAIVPHPIIPFHMNLRLCQRGQTEHQMVYNSWQNGGWENEIRPAECPFLPGLPFIMRILYLEEGFHVTVNDQYVMAFALRFPEPPLIDTVLIEGDCIVTQVSVKGHGLSTVID